MAAKIRAKDKKFYQPCKRCGASVHIDKSKCPDCGAWNVEEAHDPTNDGTIILTDVTDDLTERISTGPWDPVWGKTVRDDGSVIYGIAKSSVTLLGGAPGAGKSTLTLQLANSLAVSSNREVLIVSKEEPSGQVKARYHRLKLTAGKLLRMQPIGVDCDLSTVIQHYKPVAVIADSLKKIAESPEDQVTFCDRLKEHCSLFGTIGIIIDHINKEEDFSGHVANQHAVDTTLLFTVWGDEVRELRTVKNRNGESGVRVLFDMTERGLVHRTEDDEDEDEDDSDEEADDE